MSADTNAARDDQYLISLKLARDASAVLKLRFAERRSSLAEGTRMFVYEGSSDKLAYYFWAKALQPDLKYEPFLCGTKDTVLQLLDLLRRDVTGLAVGVYFFVDRDFDDLRDRKPEQNVFMTGTYSIENYLVTSEVLEDLLKIDFHCDGHPEARERIRTIFSATYRQFLEVTKNLNFRIFLARRLNIRQVSKIPTGVSQLAQVKLESACAVDSDPCALVTLEREPTPKEAEDLRPAFEELEPELRYRGKFALAFFSKWLGVLRQDRQCDEPHLFVDVPKPDARILGDFDFVKLAPKTAPPSGLDQFLAHAAGSLRQDKSDRQGFMASTPQGGVGAPT